MSLKVNIRKKLKDMTLDISFDTGEQKGITGLLGASGCGKSMTLKAVAGIVTPDFGQIVLDGRVLFDSKKGINRKIQDRNVGYLFQNYGLFPHMTVLENVMMAVKGTRAEKRNQALFYLKLFHAEELAGHYPGRLSGGQQQRAALARVMASKPSLLMLDEPFSAMDYYLKENLQMELLEELQSFDGQVLLVTHSRDEIHRFCETIHVMNQGTIVVSGGVKEVFRQPKTVSAARLTGCKNIVRIEHKSPHEFFVPQWGLCVIIKEREVPQEAEFIGIRAHYLKRAEGEGAENTMECRLAHFFDDPFEVTLVLENGIWWKIPKDRWKQEFQEEAPFWLTVPEEGIFFLDDL